MSSRWLRPYARRGVGVTSRSSTPLLCAVAAVIALAAAVPATTAAHPADVSTAAGHAAEDSVAPLDPATERRYKHLTAEATAADAAVAAAQAPGDDPSQVGEWGPVQPWPVVGIHVALLENGKVLAYDSVGDLPTSSYPVHNSTRATVWDPATGSHTPVNLSGFNIFCSGLAHLADGSLFLPGGNKNAQDDGIVQTHYFDAGTNAWSRGPNMAAERWYPSVTPLSNGESLITSGGPDMPEVLRTDGTLRALNTASLELPLYPWIDVAPNGRAFYSGPDQTMRSLKHGGRGLMADPRPARLRESRLRQPRPLRRRQDPRRGRGLLQARRPRDQPERDDAPGVDDGADERRPPSAQPHRAGGRHRARHRRQLLRRRPRRPRQRRVPGRAVGSRNRAVAEPGLHAGDPAVPLHSAAVARRTCAVLGRRRLRPVQSGRLPGEERRGVLPVLSVRRQRPARHPARDQLRSRRRGLQRAVRRLHAERRRRSARWRSCGWGRSRTR